MSANSQPAALLPYPVALSAGQFAEPPSAASPAPAPNLLLTQVKGVHPDNLSWKHYKKADPGTKDHDAETIYDHHRNAKMKFILCTFRDSDGRWSTSAYLSLERPKAWVVFNKKQSYVVKGQESAYLLAHEAVHLRMAEYIAQQAQTRLGQLYGTGYATSASRSHSRKEAHRLAKEDFQKRLDAFDAEWTQIDKAVGEAFDNATRNAYTQAYTDATNNGADPAAADASGKAAMEQVLADWQALHQGYADPIIQGTWHG